MVDERAPRTDRTHSANSERPLPRRPGRSRHVRPASADEDPRVDRPSRRPRRPAPGARGEQARAGGRRGAQRAGRAAPRWRREDGDGGREGSRERGPGEPRGGRRSTRGGHRRRRRSVDRRGPGETERARRREAQTPGRPSSRGTAGRGGLVKRVCPTCAIADHAANLLGCRPHARGLSRDAAENGGRFGRSGTARNTSDG